MANITDEDLDNILDEISGRIADELGVTESVAGALSFGGDLTRLAMFKKTVEGAI